MIMPGLFFKSVSEDVMMSLKDLKVMCGLHVQVCLL